MLLTFKLIYQVGVGSLLQCLQSIRLESQFLIYLICDFTYQPLEWQIGEEKVSSLLVVSNFSKNDS